MELEQSQPALLYGHGSLGDISVAEQSDRAQPPYLRVCLVPIAPEECIYRHIKGVNYADQAERRQPGRQHPTYLPRAATRHTHRSTYARLDLHQGQRKRPTSRVLDAMKNESGGQMH